MAILAAPVREMTGAKPGRRGVNYPMLGLAFVGLAVAKLVTDQREMNRRTHKEPVRHEGCTRYHSPMAPEDIIPVFEGVFVGSSEERRQHIMRSVEIEAVPPGGLFAIWGVDVPGKDPKVAPLTLEGFPKDVAFRPHGMHYRRETGELFVVNHAYSQGGERIDVFKVAETFPQDPLPEIHPSLLEGTPKPKPADERRQGGAGGSRSVGGGGGSEGERNGPEVVDIGIAMVQLGGDDDEGESADDVDGREAENAGAEAASAAAEVADGGAAGRGEEGGASSPPPPPGDEGSENGGGVACEGDGDDGQQQGVELLPELATGDAEHDAEIVEDIVETPKEKAKRVKREAKEAVAAAKAEAKKLQAEEKAISKAAAARASAQKKGLSRGETPLTLTYSFSVEHEYITSNYGVLNDLVLAGDDELYVTQFMAMRHPLHGMTHPSGLVEAFRAYGALLLMILRVPLTPIIRCTGIRGDNTQCEHLARGNGVMYNGIALSPDKERLIVSDTMGMQMLVFDRDVDTGGLSLRQRVDGPGSPDNVEIDLYRAAEGEEAYTVGEVSSPDFLAYMGAMSGAKDPSEGDGMLMQGGVSSLVYNKEAGEYASHLEMWQDGSLLSISSATSTKSDSRLLGSAVEEGFLLCRPVPCPAGSNNEDGCRHWGPPPSSHSETEVEVEADGRAT